MAPTSLKCKWNNPRQRKLTPKKSQDLTFRKIVHGQQDVATKKKLFSPVYDVQNSMDIERFKNKLVSMGSNAGWLKNFELETEKALVPKLHKIEFNFNNNVDLRKKEEFFYSYFGSLEISEHDCFKIESLTRNQGQTDSWSTCREERLTSSNFGRICKRKTSTKPDSMLKDLLGYRTFANEHTKYGQDHEDVARRKYHATMKKTHPGITVKKCGLLVTPAYPHLGASPDGFVNCTHCEDHNGLVEIKCPSGKAWRQKTPEECATDPTFFCEMVDGKVTLKRSHNYYFQVQGQLGISGRKWVDFVVWTCNGMSVERIYANPDFFKDMVSLLNQFYIDSFLPELFSRRVERGIPLYE